jgi:hypothetical protein
VIGPFLFSELSLAVLLGQDEVFKTLSKLLETGMRIFGAHLAPW